MMDVPFALAYNAGHEVTGKPSRHPVPTASIRMADL